MTAAHERGPRCHCGRPLIARPGELAETCAECRHVPNACSCLPLAAAAEPEPAFREVDLSALVRDGVPPPVLICGDLLYAGGLHSIAGPPDGGKTTIALSWVLQYVRGGRQVMFMDEEGGAELVAEKLVALGATEDEVRLIRYFPFPARAWTPYDVIRLREVLDDLKPGIILWDSAAAFLSRAGLDENSAADVTKFWAQVLTPGQPRTFFSPAVKAIALRHSRGSSRASRAGSEGRSYSATSPLQAPLPAAACTSASRQPRATAAVRMAIRASLRPA